MTTVTIEESTLRKLKKLKKEKDAGSYDELLNELADEELEIPSADEMFGSMNIGNKEDVREHSDRADRYD